MNYQLTRQDHHPMIYDSEDYLPIFNDDLSQSKQLEIFLSNLSLKLLEQLVESYPELEIVYYHNQMDIKQEQFPRVRFIYLNGKSTPELILLDRRLAWLGTIPTLSKQAHKSSSYLRLCSDRLISEILEIVKE